MCVCACFYVFVYDCSSLTSLIHKLTSNKTGQHERCHMYDYNYTKAAQLGYDVAVIHPEDLTDGDIPQDVPCNVRDFNLTQYESSMVTEVSVK